MQLTMMDMMESQTMTDRQKQFARQMRAQPTDAERVLWQRLRHDIAPVGSHFRRQALGGGEPRQRAPRLSREGRD